MQKLFRSPWLEVNVMLAVLIISYVALGFITVSAESQPGEMSGGAVWGVNLHIADKNPPLGIVLIALSAVTFLWDLGRK